MATQVAQLAVSSSEGDRSTVTVPRNSCRPLVLSHTGLTPVAQCWALTYCLYSQPCVCRQQEQECDSLEGAVPSSWALSGVQ